MSTAARERVVRLAHAFDLSGKTALVTGCRRGIGLEEVTTFYRNYHSLRFVDGDLVLRMQKLPSDATIAALNHDFAGIITSGEIAPVATSKAEIADRDVPDLARLCFRFDRHSYRGSTA